jgi:hypothetical protein
MEDVSVPLARVRYETKRFPECRGSPGGIDHHDLADAPRILKQGFNQLAPDAVPAE